MKRLIPAALGLVTAIALSGAAGAQTAPAAQGPTLSQGPVIPGVCLYNSAGAIQGSAAGKSMLARLDQLQKAAEAELNSEGAALDSEAKAIDAARASTPQDQWEQRALAFQQKAKAFERKRDLRVREMQATRMKQVDRFGQMAEPVVTQVYNEKGCSILLESASVYAANPAMDVTGLVVTRLNAKVTTMTFDRERLDQPQAAAKPAAAAPKPAAPAAPVKK